MDFGQLLLATLSPDDSVRVPASQLLDQAAKENLALYLGQLSEILAEDSNASDKGAADTRVAAGLAAKNSLVARDIHRRQQQSEAFTALSPDTKDRIKALALRGLEARVPQVASAAAQLVAALAHIELPVNAWPALLHCLRSNVMDSAEPGVRRASLEALGFICEEGVASAVLEAASGEVLEAVVRGLGSGETSLAVRLAAARALLDSLAFLRPRIEDSDAARSAVLRAVFEAATCMAQGDPEEARLLLAVAALECLVRIAQLYYAYLRPYMGQGLGELTLNAMNSPQAPIALQGIEFWSTICEVEIELSEGSDTASGHQDKDSSRDTNNNNNDNDNDIVLHHFARDAASTVLPLLLRRMAAQEHEDADEDAGEEWTPAMAAATCLTLYASAVGDAALQEPALTHFIAENLASTDWHFREAAVMAFGAVLEGPTRNILEPFALSLFPALFRLFADASISVRDTLFWALGRVCELHPAFVPLPHCEQLAGCFVQGLAQQPRVATSATWALLHLVRRLASTSGNEERVHARAVATAILPRLVQDLLSAAGRSDASDSGLRAAAYEALTGIVGTQDGHDGVIVVEPDTALLTGLVAYALDALEQSLVLAAGALNSDDQRTASEMQSSCAALLAAAVARLPASHLASPALLERMGRALLGVAQAGAAGRTGIASLEDLFLALGALLTTLSDAELGDSARVLAGPFLPFVLGGLARFDEAVLCRVLLGFVSDMARACRSSSTTTTTTTNNNNNNNNNTPPSLLITNLDNLTTALLRILQSPAAARDLKPLAITALGDVAVAVGPAFIASPHLASCMAVLGEAARITVHDETDLDEVDFVCELRLALLEATTWIVQAVQDGSSAQPAKIDPLLPHLRSVIVPVVVGFAPWLLHELRPSTACDPQLIDSLIRTASGLIGDIAVLRIPELTALLRPLVAGEFLRIVSDRISDSTVATQKWARSVV